MRSRIAAITSAVMVTLVPTAGCTSDPLPLPVAASTDISDPDKVIALALVTMFTWNPTGDASPSTAYERAAIYLTNDLAKQIGAAEPGPGSQWEQWRTNQATIAAKAYVVADETPPNSDDQMHRVVVIVQSATTADHRLIDEIKYTAWVVATRSNAGWRVASIQF
jgi:hypothetical protein